MVTKEQIKTITGILDDKVLTSITSGLTITMVKYEINTKLRICHFLAQMLHESGNLQHLHENLNYSAEGLNKTFHKYFPTLESATSYARNQEKIANKVYSNRMGNGDELSGDGYNFRGRGGFQTTGKDNYSLLSKDTGIDFINHPELLETYKYAILSAGYFWNSHKLNIKADKDDVVGITQIINGGQIGITERTVLLSKCKNIIK